MNMNSPIKVQEELVVFAKNDKITIYRVVSR